MYEVREQRFHWLHGHLLPAESLTIVLNITSTHLLIVNHDRIRKKFYTRGCTVLTFDPGGLGYPGSPLASPPSLSAALPSVPRSRPAWPLVSITASSGSRSSYAASHLVRVRDRVGGGVRVRFRVRVRVRARVRGSVTCAKAARWARPNPNPNSP